MSGQCRTSVGPVSDQCRTQCRTSVGPVSDRVGPVSGQCRFCCGCRALTFAPSRPALLLGVLGLVLLVIIPEILLVGCGAESFVCFGLSAGCRFCFLFVFLWFPLVPFL